VQLTTGTDVALRILVRLAAAGPHAELTTKQVAESVAVAYSHAVKVVARLQKLGVVDARRGRGGGLAISVEGRSRSLGELVRELEGVGDVVGCEADPPCPLRPACTLRGLLRKAQEAFYATLDPITVGDLATSPTIELFRSRSA
jgi:Rrf2 family transcriptional regulator, nitric oxide-sensitive transcriptional repressor